MTKPQQSYTAAEVLVLMKKKWNTPAKIKALQKEYGTSSYISHMFSGRKPPSYWILAELGLVKTKVIRYVPQDQATMPSE